MKEIKRYECEVCGTDYNAPDEAQKCEGSHPKVKEVRYKYGYEMMNAYPHGIEYGYEMMNAYPHGIEVEFENGTTVFYKECG